MRSMRTTSRLHPILAAKCACDMLGGTHACLHACSHACAFTCVQPHPHAYMCTTRTCVHRRMYAYASAPTYACAHACRDACMTTMRTTTHACVHACSHSCMRIVRTGTHVCIYRYACKTPPESTRCTRPLAPRMECRKVLGSEGSCSVPRGRRFAAASTPTWPELRNNK